MNDWLTLEAHAEATKGLALLGGGSAAEIANLGILTGALAASSGYGDRRAPFGPESGGQVSFGFQRITRHLSFTLEATLASAGYRDLAAVNGTSQPTSTLTASASYQFGDYGSVGIAYVRQRTDWRIARANDDDNNVVFNPQADLATASYSVPVAGQFNVYASGYKDFLNRSYGMGFGVSYQLGGDATAALNTTQDNGRYSVSASLTKPAVNLDEFGYGLQDTEGSAATRTAEGEYYGPLGRVSVGVSQASDEVAGRIGASGAVAWTGGGVFASDRIDDSFAVVEAGDVAGVPVFYENRLIGRTDDDGELLVPALLSYQNNKISLDVSRLPADIEAGQTVRRVRPPDRSGIVVPFALHSVHAALLKLVDPGGHPLPLGSLARVKGEADRPVGYDGEAYVTGLAAQNEIAVRLPDGSRCTVHVAYQPVKGDIPTIGPIPCQ